MNPNSYPFSLMAGTQLILDMKSCSAMADDIENIEAFIKSLCMAYEWDILNAFASLDSQVVNYTLNKGFVIIKIVRKHVIMELFLEDTSASCMRNLQNIKQQALDYFSPYTYRASLRPRGQHQDNR